MTWTRLDPEGGVRVSAEDEYLTLVAGVIALLQVAEVLIYSSGSFLGFCFFNAESQLLS